MRKILPALALLTALFAPGLASAQSGCPSIIFGQVLTAGQWQACFQAKQDALGFPPVNAGGGTMTGPLITAPSITGAAGFNVPSGVAPTTPKLGDIWSTAAGLFGYNGVGTVGLGTKTPQWNGGYVAGRYYVPQIGNTATGTVAANTVYFVPLPVGELHTFDRIAFQVTASGTANNARLAIYSSSGGQPSALVVDGGVVSGSNPMMSTGLKTVTISQQLSPGHYFLALVFDGSATIAAVADTQTNLEFFIGVTDLVAPDSQLTATLTFGAFPATAFSGGMGTATYTATSTPVAGLRG